MQERLGLRANEAPQLREIGLYLVVWSVLFEVIGPRLMTRATGDVWDVVSYAAGGALAALWWHRAAFSRAIEEMAAVNAASLK